MKKHIHAEPQAAVDAGGLIYTADVAILRGPLEDGAQWLPEMPRVDVLWVSMQRNTFKIGLKFAEPRITLSKTTSTN